MTISINFKHWLWQRHAFFFNFRGLQTKKNTHTRTQINFRLFNGRKCQRSPYVTRQPLVMLNSYTDLHVAHAHDLAKSKLESEQNGSGFMQERGIEIESFSPRV